MRMRWGLAGLAVLGVTGGEVRAAGAADPAFPATALSAAPAPRDVAADRAAILRDEAGFPALRRSLLSTDTADENSAPGFRLRTEGTRRRDRFGDPVPALSLIVAPGALPRAPIPRPGTRRARLLLPVWVQMGFGSWSIVTGGSYTLNPGPAARDSWHSRFAVIRTLSPRLSLGSDFSHDSPDLLDSHANNALGFGARYRLAGPLSLMLEGGPYFEHQGGTGMRAYTGFNLAF